MKQKITVIMPLNTGLYKDDTTCMVEGLKDLGHHVNELSLSNIETGTRELNDADFESCKGSNFIYCPYEALLPIAYELKSKLKIPVFGHIEIMPPGRFFLDNIELHYLVNTIDLSEEIMPKEFFRYKNLTNLWDTCDIRSCIDEWTLSNFELLVGRHFRRPVFLKAYPLDFKMLESYKKDLPKKNQICSVMRFVPHKKIHHIIKALSLLKNPPKYVIIGKTQGPCKLDCMKYAESLGVNIEFSNIVNDEEKCKIIQESLFCIYPFAWLPPAEAAYFSVPSIVYDRPDTRTRLGNMPVYCNNNDIFMLSSLIEVLSQNDEYRTACGKQAKDVLINKECMIFDKKDAAEHLINSFMMYKEMLSAEDKHDTSM